jgi:RNA polymerase sigma-70 factor (ECF subfamily)
VSSAPDGDTTRLVERLAASYGCELLRFIVRRIRALSDAEDLAQETYARLIRVKRKDLIREPRAYLYRTAINVMFDFEVRRKADVAGLLHWMEASRSEEGFVDGEEETLELHRRLEAVIGELSPKCRAVLILHRQEGMTYEEIGSRLGISPSMVKKYLIKGLHHCRERLQDLRQ